MKIAFNLMSLPGDRVYGVGVFLREMCRDVEADLARRNATIDVFHHADCDPARLFGLRESPRIRHLPIPGVTGRGRRVAWEQFALPRRLVGVDLLYSPNNINPLRLPRGTASIVTIHDLLPFDRETRFGGVQLAYLRGFTRASAKRARLVLTVSETSAAEIRTRLGLPDDRVAVVRNVVARPEHIEPAVPGDPPTFLVVASVHVDKRIDLALRGFARFAARHPGHRLDILGSDQGALAELRALSGNLGIAESVRFRGYVDDPTKWRSLQACTAVLLFGRKEGFGIPVLEAMAVGKPSIVGPEGALPEIAGEAGIVVEPTSASQVADALERLSCGAGIDASVITRRFATFDPATQRRRFWDLLAGGRA